MGFCIEHDSPITTCDGYVHSPYQRLEWQWHQWQQRLNSLGLKSAEPSFGGPRELLTTKKLSYPFTPRSTESADITFLGTSICRGASDLSFALEAAQKLS